MLDSLIVDFETLNAADCLSQQPINQQSAIYNQQFLPCVISFEPASSPAAKTIFFGPSRRKPFGQGSVAEGEYLRNMNEARLCSDQTVRWVEVCYCPAPLQEERPYWEEYFDLTKVQDAHDRRNCRDENGNEPWACGDCDCTARLEKEIKSVRRIFQDALRNDTGRMTCARPIPEAIAPQNPLNWFHDNR